MNEVAQAFADSGFRIGCVVIAVTVGTVLDVVSGLLYGSNNVAR